jgi:hypothetical protein
MEIGAYCQTYKQPVALDHSLRCFRNAYPKTTVVLVSDNGCNYSDMATKYNCTYFHETMNTRMGWFPHEREKYLEFLNRMRKYIPLIKEEYFMLLEEDVHVLRPITEPLLGTVNANGYNKIGHNVLKDIKGLEDRTDGLTYIVQGGSIWHKESFLKIINNIELCDYVHDAFVASQMGHCVFDFFISAMCALMGGTFHKLECHKELWTDNLRSLDSVAILNQVKHFYTNDPVDLSVIY